LRGENTVAESNPTRVLSRQSENFEFQIFQIYQLLLRIVPHTHDNLHYQCLNREGVELQFHQSHQFKLTTNPLGKFAHAPVVPIAPASERIFLLLLNWLQLYVESKNTIICLILMVIIYVEFTTALVRRECAVDGVWHEQKQNDEIYLQ
jgi:hypothetical protein